MDNFPIFFWECKGRGVDSIFQLFGGEFSTSETIILPGMANGPQLITYPFPELAFFAPNLR